MPHRRLLLKLSSYGIDNSVYHWSETWLIHRTQQVVMDGECSFPGVPQGTVLGPLMFLIYVNDIAEQVSSPLCLFADDCFMYQIIRIEVDTHQLQLDLDCLTQWAQIWQTSFNVNKCVVMKCSKSPSVIS